MWFGPNSSLNRFRLDGRCGRRFRRALCPWFSIFQMLSCEIRRLLTAEPWHGFCFVNSRKRKAEQNVRSAVAAVRLDVRNQRSTKGGDSKGDFYEENNRNSRSVRRTLQFRRRAHLVEQSAIDRGLWTTQGYIAAGVKAAVCPDRRKTRTRSVW